MTNNHLLWPIIAQVILIAIVWLIMGRRRLQGLKKGVIKIPMYSVMKLDNVPDYYIVAARNFDNLMQLPLLFILSLLIAMQFELTNPLMLTLASAYVFLRYVHSFIHITSNNIRYRFYSYIFSCLALWSIWLTLSIQLLF